METLKIDGKKAKKLFPKASPEFQEMLKDTFGENFFSEKITDRIKTFEDACEVLGVSPNVFGFSDYDTKDEVAYKKLKIIILALNEGWIPDWNNGNQKKWYPYFTYKSGFGCSGPGYGGWLARADVGSRLCFKTEELAEYAAKQFLPIYQDFLTL